MHQHASFCDSVYYRLSTWTQGKTKLKKNTPKIGFLPLLFPRQINMVYWNKMLLTPESSDYTTVRHGQPYCGKLAFEESLKRLLIDHCGLSAERVLK